jgi:hypothetical protein
VSIQIVPETRKEKPAPLEIPPLGVGRGEMRNFGQTPKPQLRIKKFDPSALPSPPLQNGDISAFRVNPEHLNNITSKLSFP